AGRGQVAVDLAALAEAALPVVEVVGVAALVDGDLAETLDLDVARVATGSLARGAFERVLLAGHGGSRAGDLAGIRFTQIFAQPASTKLAGLVTYCKSSKLRGKSFFKRRGRVSPNPILSVDARKSSAAQVLG